MTEALSRAKNTLLKQQVGEHSSPFVTKSLSPTPTSSSKSGSSVGSELVRAASMGSEGGEQSEIIVEPVQDGAVVLPVPSSIKEGETSEKSYTFSDGERSRNPEPEEVSTTSGVVVPSVIRISPKASKIGNGNASIPSANNRYSPRVPVVRPVASKTPPQETSPQHNGKPQPGEASRKVPSAKAPENTTKPSAMGERGGKGEKQAGKSKEETKRRDESSQTNFPRRNNRSKRMTAGKVGGGADGQAPAQHVQYSNAGTGGRQQHANRHDPHGGYRQQQHGRAVHGSSVTSSIGGGTPTMVGRRGPHHTRGLSTGSHTSDMDNETSPAIPPATPLFQRLVTEEVQELKTYTRIIEEQNRRVTELERRTADLEKRLRKKEGERVDLERTLEYREAEWRSKFERLQGDRDRQKELVEQEKRMNTKLNYQVAQMEQEIHKFLTRKYPQQRENISSSVRNVRMIQNDRGSPSLVSGSATSKTPSSPGHGGDRKREPFKSPREILENDGRVEVVRKRNIASSLLDFFGMP